MISSRRGAAALAGLTALAAGPASAHPGHAHEGFAAGLLHPVTGLDHVLAMVAVGLWAAGCGRRALWAWPCAFVSAMLAGYALGAAHPGATGVDGAILASVIILGAAIATAGRAPFWVGVATVAAFGALHGYAHGAEAPPGSGWAFPAGFALTTALLHGAGLVAGLAILKAGRPRLLRGLGLGVAVGGVALALGA